MNTKSLLICSVPPILSERRRRVNLSVLERVTGPDGPVTSTHAARLASLRLLPEQELCVGGVEGHFDFVHRTSIADTPDMHNPFDGVV
jgi:hypothetical protein